MSGGSWDVVTAGAAVRPFYPTLTRLHSLGRCQERHSLCSPQSHCILSYPSDYPSTNPPFFFTTKSKHRHRDNHGWRARYPTITIVIVGAGSTTTASDYNIRYHTSGAAFEARERAGFGSGVEPLCGEGGERGVFGSAAVEEVGGGGVRGRAGMLV